jgi:hypothetical protein
MLPTMPYLLSRTRNNASNSAAATWDPAHKGANLTLTNGNLTGEYTGSNNGSWNNNGSADPATNTGGYAVSLAAGTLFACLLLETTDKGTVRFSSASWTDTAPSGFSQLS